MPDTNRPKVYVVDDEPLLLRPLQRILRRAGFAVETFTSAAQVLELLSAGSAECPDLIVSDYWMGELDGVAFLRSVRAIHPRICTVLLSGQQPEYGDLHDAIDATISKPWTDSELLNCVRRLIYARAALKDPAGPSIRPA